jgi:hypothetical protein
MKHEHNHPNTEPEDFFTEIRKLEVRLKDYLNEEKNFTESLKKCIKKLQALHESLEQKHVPLDAAETEEISKLKSEVMVSLSEVMKKEGKAEHEKNHLFDSYAAIILELQNIGVP